MSLPSRAQRMRTGPRNECCWSAHSGRCLGCETFGARLNLARGVAVRKTIGETNSIFDGAFAGRPRAPNQRPPTVSGA